MFDPVKITTAVTTVTAMSWFTNDISVPIMGVKVTVIVAALVGTLASFATSEPAHDRKQFFLFIFGFTFFGAVGAAIIPHMVGWDWVTDEMKAPLAALISFVSKIFMMPIVTRGKELIKSWTVDFNFIKKKDPPNPPSGDTP